MTETSNRESSPPVCPLCNGNSVGLMAIQKGRDQAPGLVRYHRCGRCESIFMNSADHLSVEEERKRYDAHENESDQQGYLDYLEPLRARVKASLRPGAEGLDYGSGPNPVLAESFRRDGIQMQTYDPCFGPKEWPPGRLFDVITATEVIEHFHTPYLEFEKLKSLLKPGASLWLMTQLWREDLDFRKWHYRRDPTHVFFYSEKALEWIRDEFGFERLERPDARVIRFVVSSV